MQEVIRVNVELDAFHEVHSDIADITMIPFHGTFTSGPLNGTVLSGGADTQIEYKGKTRTLSARYILEGELNGNKYHLFVENNGSIKNNVIETKPIVITDCPDLKYLEGANLSGSVEGAGEGRVTVHIYLND